jgi:undecaprenyl-phosphate galactose phosphotransferase
VSPIHYFICALSLVLADVLAWVLSFTLAAPPLMPVPNLLVLLVLWLLWFGALRRRYQHRQPFWSELLSLIKGSAAFMAFNLLASLLAAQKLHLLAHARWGLELALLLVLARALARSGLNQLGIWARPVVIFGAGENSQQAALALRSEPGMGFDVHAFFTPPPRTAVHVVDTGKQREWPQSEAEYKALQRFHCIIALEANQSELRDHLIRQLSQHQIKSVSVIPSMRGVPLFGLETTQFFNHEVLMIHVRNNLMSPFHRWIKRVFDVIGASCLIVLLSPLMLWVGYKIWRSDGAPVIFSQPRVGQGLQTFKFYKFRSMVKNAEDMLKHWEATHSPEWQEYTANNFKLANDPRLISIGALIRRTSIDELPQLFNVIMGDMSLVGPRPLLPREINDYGEDVYLYGQTPPGLTGLWQVSGRSQTTFEDRVAFDTWYVKNWSIWTDITILFKTWSVVFKRNGAY